jgi:hypothetical protein
MLRVLKPGRKLALAVWHFAERNPFHYALSRVIEGYVDSPPPAPDAPDPFRFASPGKLRDVLAESGAMAPSERLLQFTSFVARIHRYPEDLPFRADHGSHGPIHLMR